MATPPSSHGTPLRRGDVEEHAAPGDAVALLVDRVVQRAARRDVARGIAVVELVVVEDVRERVPLRRALQRHHDVVVGVAEAAGHVVLRLARRGHEVQRVLADAAAGLRAELVERDAEVEHLARAHEPRRRDHPLGRDQVGGAALVVGAPPSPVAQPLTDRPEVVHPRTLSRNLTPASVGALYACADASLMGSASTHGDDAERAAHEGVDAAEVGVRARREIGGRAPGVGARGRRAGVAELAGVELHVGVGEWGTRRRSTRCTAPCTR